jgi:hypothetical protein
LIRSANNGEQERERERESERERAEVEKGVSKQPESSRVQVFAQQSPVDLIRSTNTDLISSPEVK